MPERYVIEVDLDGKDVLRDGRRVSGEIRRVGTAATGSTAKVGLLTRALNSLKANAIVAGIAAIYGAFRLLGSSVRGAGIQDIAERKLEQALRNVGEAGGGAAERLQRLAAETQKVSNAGDEAIITAQALLLSFGEVGGEKGAALLTKNLVDTAAGISKVSGEQVDLNTVAQAFGRALTQGTGALTRYGVSLTDTQKAAFDASEGLDRVRLLSEILDSNFGGLAEATVDPVVQLKNAAGDLGEAAGGPIRDQINVFADELTRIAQSEGAATVVQYIGKTIAEVFRGLGFVLSIPRRIVDFFRIELREAAADVQQFAADTATRLASLVQSTGDALDGLPGIGDFLGERADASVATLERFAAAAQGTADANREAAAETRRTREEEEAAREARLAAADAAQTLTTAVEETTESTGAATEATEKFVGAVARLTEKLEKLARTRDDLTEADFDELVRLRQRANALENEIRLRNRLVEITAENDGRIAVRDPREFGRRGEARRAPGTPTVDELDLSGADVEIRNTQAAVEDLTTASDGLGAALAGASDLASAAFGRQAGIFKAVAIAEATIAAYLAASKELSRGGGLTLGSALSILGIGLGWAATIGSVSVPRGGGSTSTGGSPRRSSSVAAGISFGGGAGGSGAPQFSATVANEIVAVDGFAIRSKIKDAGRVEEAALGRPGGAI